MQPDRHHRSLRKRLGPLAGVALALVTMVGLAQLGANSSASARPALPETAPAAAPPEGSTVKVNRDPEATAGYWTKARMNSAEELVPTRTDANGASYGTANLDFTRSRITPQSANTQAPYRITGKLYFSDNSGGNYQCSASVIARRVLITAAHCLHDGTNWFTNFAFIPAFDGTKSTLTAQRPLGTWVWTRAEVPVNWITTAGALPNATDFGAIVVSDQSFNGGAPVPVAQRVGRYQFAINHLWDNHVTMLGYPCNFDSCNIMQRNDSSDHRIPPGYTGGNVYEYGSDMTGGSSGGPWLENFGTGAAPQGSWVARNSVVGVTSYIYNDGDVKILGASQLDSRWNTIYNNSCAAATGNC